MMKKQISIGIFLLLAVFTFNVFTQKRGAKPKTGKICGNPQIKCRTGDFSFESYQIGFELGQGRNVIAESETFYSIILKTVKLNEQTPCESSISEGERLEIQNLFPDHKVFALKCSEAGDEYFSNTADNISFIAVYAGKTLIEAKKFLTTVQATGKFKSANVRRMQTGFNGT